MGMKLRSRERIILNKLNGEKATVFTIPDRETVRQVGEVAKRLDIRDTLYIGKDTRKGVSVVIDTENKLVKLLKH